MRSPDEGFGEAVFRDLQSEGADPLALFESEEELNRPGRPAHQRSRTEDVVSSGVSVVPFAAQPSSGPDRMSGPIALDLVLHRLGHVSWMEAVAIVEGLCGILNARGSLRVPEMSRIAITAEGTVAAGEGGGDDAVLLARVLHELAAPGWIPASLRLFVTKWVSNGGEHSIAEFAKELAYFAPLDGQALIRAVYERAVATVPATVEPRPWVPRQQPPGQPSQRARILYGSAAAVVVLGIALFSLRGAPEQPDQSRTPEPTALQEEVTEPASLALVNGSSGILVPGGQTPPESPPQGVPAPPRPAARSTQARAGSPSAARPRAGGRSGASAAAPVSSAVRAPVAPSPRSVPVPFASADPPSRAVRLNPAPAPRRDIELGPPVYSSLDSDVTPPAFLNPQLPSPLLSGSGPDMNTLELIVSETGTVERVRLLSTPKRMADMMLLSGAKNWEFEPAVRDGQSVRYRLELSWAATP